MSIYSKCALVCVDTVSALIQEFPCYHANQAAMIRGLEKLNTIFGYPCQIVIGGHISKFMMYKTG